MALTRYEFELLTYIERNGDTVYNIRTISDAICISGTEVTKDIEKFLVDGILVNNSDVLTLTKKGLDALEPYRVKNAVILAAGFGNRMLPATADRPKPMVTVCGKRIIDTLIDALVEVGIKDITIVRGYKKEVFDDLLEKYPFIELRDNDLYAETNNISSAMLLLDKLNGCYLCESDLYITNPKVITKYQYCSNILGSWSLETDDWSFRMKDGFITDYQKGNTYCHNYYGISYWTAEDCEKLKRDFTKCYNELEGGKDYFWEFIPLVLFKEDYNVEIRPCNKQDIMEIDNFYELEILDPSYKNFNK